MLRLNPFPKRHSHEINHPLPPRLAGRQFLGVGRRGQGGFAKNFAGKFLGDPPGEPQGLNSVFDTDTSTLAIIKNANAKLKTLHV